MQNKTNITDENLSNPILVYRKCQIGEFKHCFLSEISSNKDNAIEDILINISDIMKDVTPYVIPIPNKNLNIYYDVEGNKEGDVILETDISDVKCDHLEIAEYFVDKFLDIDKSYSVTNSLGEYVMWDQLDVYSEQVNLKLERDYTSNTIRKVLILNLEWRIDHEKC